jgi:RNA polymerase sigma factor (sigma-70 family)
MVVSSREMLDYAAERPRLFRLAMRFLHNVSEAEELADAAIAKALTHRDRHQPKNEKAWLVGILRNECLHRIRDRKKEELHRFPEEYGKTPLEIAMQRELQDAVDQAVMDLTPEEWWVLYHYQFEDLSGAETAGKMSRTNGSVRALMHRLKRKLAPKLAEFVTP